MRKTFARPAGRLTFRLQNPGMRVSSWTRCLPLAVVAALVGCGEAAPTSYPVTGTVSYQGKPLPLGVVMFISDNGPAAASNIGEDGTYRLEAVPGKHRVSVVAMPKQQGRPDPTVEGGIDTTGFPPVKSLIPQAASTLNCNQRFKNFDGSAIAEPFPRPVVDQVCVMFQFLPGDVAEVGPFGNELPQQAVGVFICAALP